MQSNLQTDFPCLCKVQNPLLVAQDSTTQILVTALGAATHRFWQPRQHVAESRVIPQGIHAGTLHL